MWHRLEQGRIRQRCCHECSHQIGRQNGCGEGTETTQGVPHEHGGPLNNLLEKGSGLLSPNPVIQWTSLANPRLLRCAKSQEVEAEHLPALGRQFRRDAPPVPARGPETMQEHEGWAMTWPQNSPMTCPCLMLLSTTWLSTPSPFVVVPPGAGFALPAPWLGRLECIG